MAIDVTIRRTLGGWVPANRHDAEALDRFPVGSVARASFRKPRNPKHHAKFFALLNVVFPHQQAWPTMELFRKAIQRALGYFEEHNGMIFDVSIAFDRMDQDEFARLYERAVELMITRILPSVDRADLEREVQEILAGRQAA